MRQIRERILGIPVDVFLSYSFAQAHPYWTALVVVALIALAWFVLRFSRRLTKHQGKLRFGMFAVYLAVALPMVWVLVKPEPSPMLLLMDGLHQAQYSDALQKAQQTTTPTK
jgi:ABC-type amino acid transport system permease subunit